jgi:hypothetical protein
VRSRLEGETLTIDTSAPGHPLLVKMSYHPRWRAEGADGPYPVSPALMLVIPRGEHVRLVYGPTRWDTLGFLLPVLAVLVLGLLRLRPAPRPPEPSPALLALAGCEPPKPTLRWGGAIPGLFLALCLAGRLLASPHDPSPEAHALALKARAAAGEGRGADAAEYARAGLFLRPSGELRLELFLLRGEGLLGSDPSGAARAFAEVTKEASPFLADALFGAYHAGVASGDLAGAGVARERLLREFGGTPQAHAVRKEVVTSGGGPGR